MVILKLQNLTMVTQRLPKAKYQRRLKRRIQQRILSAPSRFQAIRNFESLLIFEMGQVLTCAFSKIGKNSKFQKSKLQSNQAFPFGKNTCHRPYFANLNNIIVYASRRHSMPDLGNSDGFQFCDNTNDNTNTNPQNTQNAQNTQQTQQHVNVEDDIDMEEDEQENQPTNTNTSNTRPRRDANSRDVPQSSDGSEPDETEQQKVVRLNEFINQIENNDIPYSRSDWMHETQYCFINNTSPENLFWDYCYDITPVQHVNAIAIVAWIERGDTIKILQRDRLRTYSEHLIDKLPTSWEIKEWFLEIWQPPQQTNAPPPSVTRQRRNALTQSQTNTTGTNLQSQFLTTPSRQQRASEREHFTRNDLQLPPQQSTIHTVSDRINLNSRLNTQQVSRRDSRNTQPLTNTQQQQLSTQPAQQQQALSTQPQQPQQQQQIPDLDDLFEPIQVQQVSEKEESS